MTAPALVFGSDVTGLAVLRSMGRNGVPAYVAGTRRSLVGRSRWFAPAPGEPIEETSDGARVGEYLSSLGFDRAVPFPCSDDWSLALASLPPDVAGSFPAPLASRATLELLVNKRRFAEAAREHGVPTPRTVAVAGPADLDALEDAELGDFFLKPVNSQLFMQRFGFKGVRLSTRADAEEQLGRLAGEDLEVLAQEIVPGPATAHVFLDGYVDRTGAMRACLARRRLRMFPAEFGNSTLSVTIPLEEVEEAVASLRRLFDALGYVGLFDAEFKHDHRDGRFKVLEVNARPWWQLELAGACGLDVTQMAYRDALGLPLEPARGYRLGRVWVHPLRDLRAWRAGRGVDGAAGGFPLRHWFTGANAIFSWDDPMPVVDELERLARQGAAKVHR